MYSRLRDGGIGISSREGRRSRSRRRRKPPHLCGGRYWVEGWLVCPESDHGVDAGGAKGGNIAGEGSDGKERQRHRDIGSGVPGRGLEEKRRNHPGGKQRSADA